jgi:hypothetical protein
MPAFSKLSRISLLALRGRRTMRIYLDRSDGRPSKPRWRARQRDSLGRTALAVGLVILAFVLVAYPLARFVP